jgi:signal transduction histidine kinase
MDVQIQFLAFTVVPGGVMVGVIVYSSVKIYELGDYRPFLLILLLVSMTFHQATEIPQYAAGTFYGSISSTAEVYETGANLIASLASFLVVRQIDELRTTRDKLERSNAALEERSSMVSVLNRVLRHNVRNDVNVIAGQAEYLEDRIDDECIGDQLETIEETALGLATISDRTRRIRQLLTEDPEGETTLRLGDRLETALEGVRQSTSEATVTLERPGDSAVVVEGTSTLPTVIADVVERVVIANEGAIRVDVTVASRAVGDGGDGAAVVRIDDDGEGLPDLDVRAVESDAETPLRHAEGLELWCLEWAVKRADGELDTRPAGATIEVRLPEGSRPA